MPLYEHVFLARQDLAQAQVDALAENASKIITDHKGKVTKTETWGLRGLAYRIAKNNLVNLLGYNLPREIWEDIPLQLTDTLEARSGKTERREAALGSGAQYVSTDYMQPDPRFPGYSARLPDGTTTVCNPVRAQKQCGGRAVR